MTLGGTSQPNVQGKSIVWFICSRRKANKINRNATLKDKIVANLSQVYRDVNFVIF